MSIMTPKIMNASFFTCGWKPVLTWICVIAAFENYVLSALIEDVSAVMGRALILPRLNSETVFTLTATLLGLGSIHSYDRKNGNVRDPE